MAITLGVRKPVSSTSGAPILVTSEDENAPTAIDVAIAGGAHFDQEVLTLENLTDHDVVCTIKWGAVVDIGYPVPAYGSRTVKKRVNGGLAITAFMDAGNGSQCAIHPEVNTLTIT